MTDTTPTGSPAPKRRAPAKTTGEPKSPATRARATKAPTTAASVPKASAAKASVPKASAPKTPTTRTSAAQTPAAQTPAAENGVPPVELAATAVPAAAMAPAGWYPVAAGSAQQRWWDGARWTEHTYDPPATFVPQPAPGVQNPGQVQEPPLRAEAGVRPGNVWFWLLVVGAPVLTILDLIPLSIYLSQAIGVDSADPTAAVNAVFSPAYLLVLLSGWFIYAYCIVFGLLDWRTLRARGVPKPFHWAWSFFVIAVGWPAVYVIGRTVVARRRTGSGLAPLWVFIGLEVVTFVVTVVIVVSAIMQLITVVGDSFSDAAGVF